MRLGLLAALVFGALTALPAQIFVAVHGNSTLREYAFDGSYNVVAAYPDVNAPYGVTLDSAGNRYITGLILGGQGKVNKISPDGTVTAFAITPLGPRDVDIGPDGNLYVAIQDGTIWRYGPDGNGTQFASGIANPISLAFDRTGNLFVSAYTSKSILQITPAGEVSTFVTTGSLSPAYLAFDADDNLFVSFAAANTIMRYAPDGTASTFATTFLHSPSQLAFDPFGNLWVANAGDGTLVYFDPAGTGSVFTSLGLNSSAGIAFAPVPEPATTAVLLGLGAGLMVWCRRRRNLR